MKMQMLETRDWNIVNNPPKPGMYLCTVEYGEQLETKIVGFTEGVWHDTVIAWQELPKPYSPTYEFPPEMKKKFEAVLLVFPEYRYVALDRDGNAYLYKKKPKIGGGVWVSYDKYIQITSLNNYMPEWEYSLIDLYALYRKEC